MDYAFLGKLIEYERTTRNIASNKLTKGVCSVTTLHRLEYGKRLPSFFIIERLLERLGKSVNKIEFLYNEVDYEIYYLREKIENQIEEKEIRKAEEYLEYYCEMIRDFSSDRMQYNIHLQYINKIKAVIYALKKEYKKAKEFLLRSILITLPGFKNYAVDIHLKEEGKSFSLCKFLRENIVGEEEMILLLLWIQESSRGNDNSRFLSEGREILKYINRVYEDEEVKVNVYSKAAWIFSAMAMERGQRKEAYWYILEGERILTDNVLLLYLPQFLDRILFLSDQVDRKAYYEWKEQREALKLLYEEYGKSWEEEEPYIWRNYRQQELYLVSELLEQERKLSEKSQGKLANDMEIDLKTINRIEKGKFKPKPGTFKKIKNHLMIDRDVCTTRIITEDFSLLDLEREIARLNHQRREEEAEKLYWKLKESLSLEWKENRQYIIYMDMLFNHQLGRITTEEALEQCRRAFLVTREKIRLDQSDQIILSRMECFILNYICRCYDKLAAKEEAVWLLEKIVRGYENSKIDRRYRYAPLSLLYEHLAIDCEETGKLEEAIQWCNKAIDFDLLCNRAGNLGFMLEQKIFVLEKSGKSMEWCKEKYLQAYNILKLMKQKKHLIILQSYLTSRF